jgi:CBS domain-containing protein
MMKVSEIMTKKLVCCLKTDTAQTVAEAMKLHDIGAVPVVSNLVSKRLEGIVTDRDLCVRLIAAGKDPRTTQIGALMTPDPAKCAPEDSLEQCETRMREFQVRRLPVVDEQGRCVGMIAQADVVLHETPEKVRHMIAGISVPRMAGIAGSHAAA